MMPKIHLIMMPQYVSRVPLPPFGIASLKAYLHRYYTDIDVKCSDLREVLSDGFLFSGTDHYNLRRTAYVSEIPDLPLILHLVKNFKKNEYLLKDFDEKIQNYCKMTSMSYFGVKNSIKKSYYILRDQLENFLESDVLGFTTVISNLFLTIMLSLMLRQIRPNVKIVYGGPQTTISENSAKLILKLGIADVVVIGEGERVLLNLVDAYCSNKSLAVEGTITYDSVRDKFIVKDQKSFLNLDNLPDPDFSQFNLKKYAPLSLPIAASRGCPFNCKFCTYKRLAPFRQRNPVYVVDTIKNLQKKFNTIRFIFTDSALNIKTQWLEQFTNELLKRKVNIQWSGYFKPWIKKGLLQKLKKSGLFEVNIGVESFVDEVLDLMGKGNTNSSDIIKTIDSLCSEDIRVRAGIIVGFPGSSKANFLYTWRHLLQLNEKYPKHFIMAHHLFQVRPSTDCYNNPQNFGIKLKKWPKNTYQNIQKISDIVENIPMSFSTKYPTIQEILDRYILTGSVRQINNLRLTEAEIKYSSECLKYITDKSSVKINMDNIVIHKWGNKSFYSYEIEHGSFISILEKDMSIIKILNEVSSIFIACDIISKKDKVSKKNAYYSIIQLINYLNNNYVPLQIKIDAESQAYQFGTTY